MLMGVELVQAHDGLGSVSGLPARLGGWNQGIGMLANPGKFTSRRARWRPSTRLQEMLTMENTGELAP